VLKMSELSPLTAAGWATWHRGRHPGGRAERRARLRRRGGEPLVAHPDVRVVSFTGSTATGQRIVRAAA